MKTMKLGTTGLQVPVIAVGCWRLNSLNKTEARAFLQTAIDSDANFFDHADIYGEGSCEALFAEALEMNGSIREKIMIQSKCGIVPGKMYNFSKEYILGAVDGSLKRLKTEYLDSLLLHRPDALMEPDEVAEAFDRLQTSGKVRHFGVSNFNPWQIQLLQKSVQQPIAANQLQFSITHSMMITTGLNVNTPEDAALDRDGGVLDFCRLHDITIQPWSPFQYAFCKGPFLDNDLFPELNARIGEIAARHNVSKTTIALAWILRHPAHMQPVIGTMNIGRLKDCLKACEIELTRAEWYEIYLAAGNNLP